MLRFKTFWTERSHGATKGPGDRFEVIRRVVARDDRETHCPSWGQGKAVARTAVFVGRGDVSSILSCGGRARIIANRPETAPFCKGGSTG